MIWGIALASLLYGTPIDADGRLHRLLATSSAGTRVLAGVALVVLFAFHGAVFLTLRTVGELRDRAEGLQVGSRLLPS